MERSTVQSCLAAPFLQKSDVFELGTVMGREIAVGVGISVVFAFLRWAVPVMPKPIAWAGVIAAVSVLLGGIMMPQLNLTIPVIGLVLLGPFASAGLGT